MRATAIVPVKRFGAAKTRLGAALGERRRVGLVLAMVDDVLAALTRCAALESVIVVSGEPDAHRRAERHGMRALEDPGDRGHSQAATLGIRAALAAGADCVALLPGDCPLLDPGELESALAGAGEPPWAGVVPDRHGSGTNGLLLRPPAAIEPAFGAGSRERHMRAAAAADVHGELLALPSLALDLDTPSDLEDLRAVLEADPGRAPATARALVRFAEAGAGR